MRLETGSKSEAVFASQSVVIAKARGGTPTCIATVRATGVSSTAVVSRLSRMVQAHASTTMRSHSTTTRPRADPGGQVRGLVEDAREVADLSDDGDGHEEDEDGQDPLGEHGEIGHRAAGWCVLCAPARGSGRPARRGSTAGRAAVGASAGPRSAPTSRSARALGERGASACDQRARHEPTRVLRVVRCAGHRDLHPRARRARPWVATSRHTSWIGSRRPAHAA